MVSSFFNSARRCAAQPLHSLFQFINAKAFPVQLATLPKWRNVLAMVLLILGLLLGQTFAAFAANPVAVQTFFVPLPEEQVRTSLLTIYSGTGATLHGVIGLSVTASGTIIYYDQWENGYESNITNPSNLYNAGNLGGTQIWGDGNTANGNACPLTQPASLCTNDILTAGAVLVLENDITIPRNPATILYDGRDKIGSSKVVAMTKSAWALAPGTVLADAVEVVDTTRWGTDFRLPIGEDLNTVSANMFEYVSLLVMAADDNTQVQIDKDGNGTTDITQTLSQGQSYQVSSATVGDITSNARITSTKSIQVDLLTGDIGSSYESRWYNIPPLSQLGSSYYTPVGTTKDAFPATVWLYNTSQTTAITVNYETQAGTGSFSIPAKGAYRFAMPIGSGAHFYTSNSAPFIAVGAMDSSTSAADQTYDWGYTLVPDSSLTTALAVGWAPGTTDLSGNGSPVWITAVKPTTIYVDYDGNPATGASTAPNGAKYDISYGLTAFESKQIYDPDKNQTGMRIYTVDGVTITGAWGEDPSTAAAGNPYMDVGYTIPPLPAPVVEKSASLLIDNNGNGKADPSDTLAYTISVRNLGVVTLFNTVVSDTAPSNTTYVTNTTKFNASPISDNIAPASTFPLDEGGMNIGNLIVGGKAELTYQMKANAFPPTYTSLVNMVTIAIGSDIYTAQATTPVNLGTISQCTLDFVNSGGTAVATYLENSTVYLEINDADQNTNNSSSEIITVNLQNPTTGDRETLSLTETAVNTGIFRGSILASVTSGATIGDGTLKASAGDTLNASYTDAVFADSCTDSASITLPSQTKVLYLSDPNQALDRIDPVATVDTSTMSTTLLGNGGGITVVGSAAFTTTAQTASSHSFSYDSGSTGTNRILMVGISYRNNDSELVNAVTYAGQTMSLVGTDQIASGTPDGRIYIYSLLNPPTGNNTLSVTWNGALNNGGVIGAITYANVNQSVSTGSFITNAATSSTPVITVTSASNELVFGVVGGRTTNTYNVTSGGTSLWSASAVSGQTAGSGQSKLGSSPSITLSWSGTSALWIAGGVSLKPASATAVPSTTFTQTLPMASNLVMPAGGLITVTQYISVASGIPAAPVEMTATLKIGSSSFATLTNPALTSLGGGIYRLVWSGALATNTTVSTGQQVVLTVVSSEPGVSFYILYDSSTYPSQIQLPTTTVIDVTSFGIYDAPYPGGTLLTGASNGQTVYVRATVSDPFGATDITSATVAIQDPNNITTTVNLTSTHVVSSSGSSKTYEYAWNTPGVQGGYTVRVTAYEGYEGITDSASTPFNLNFQDTGTPSKSEFTTGDNGPATNSYTPNSTICVRVTDIDQNTNPAVAETITAVITSSSGDSETVTLTETGLDTGIFTKCIPSNTTTNSAGTLLAPAGATLTVRYVDPNDATDVSSATATISSPSPALSLSKLSVDPSDGIAVVGETVRFDVVASNPGPTTLNTVVITDTFPNGCLSYQSASLAPSAIVTPTLTWSNIGPIASGGSKSISLYFLVTAACSPATNSATASAIDSNSLPVSTSPTTATVATTRPGLSVSKTLLTPISGTAQLGDPVSFRITLTNTGSVTITSLPLSDNYSAGCLAYGSASPAADNAASGVALWNNLGPLAPGNSMQVDVNFTVIGGCAPTTNFADVSAAVDQNGDAVPAAQGSANVTTVGGTISGAVYNDLNGNGVQDSGEPGISGVLITLSNGTTATTSASGLYTITNLSLGTYTITETDPSGYTSTGDTQGANDNTISVTLSSSGVSGNNFLDAQPVTITGHVYNDINANGNFNLGEVGIANVVITLSTGIATSTDANGVYTFTNVLPGTYTITETNPSNYTSTGDVQGANDDLISVTVTSGVNVTGRDFFDALLGNITGGVFEDLNGNGVRDPGEPGISGVLITLSNGANTTTDASGLYTLTVPVGTYFLTETNPSGYTSTGDTFGTNDDSIGLSVSTGGVSNNNFLDARPVTITGHVYNDLNGNGAFNSGETGIPSVVITLSTGTATSTDANGVYTFTNVLPGTYTLTETNPSGYTSTGDVQGANDDRISVTVTSGVNVTGRDFFDTQFAGITGAVYEDLNGNGVRDSGEPGISGVLILLSNGTTTTTNASGVYTFTNLTPGAYTITETNPSGYTSTGDTQGANDDVISVTLGTGGSSNNNFLDAQPVIITGHVYNDLNGNGAFNSGETGIPSVVVTLSTGIATSTDANGVYTFTNVLPGTYTMTETNPSGYTSTGDVQGANDDRITLTVTSGNNVNNQDFFDTQFANITGGVYDDLNGNGVRDSGEPGISGVLILLSNGTTTTTNSSGLYTFTVPVGTYTMTETNPSGYTSTGDTQGANDNTITLTVGTGGSNNNNFLDARPVTITGHVYNDLNGNGSFNSGELGISGVVITLSTGITAATDANGVYTFTNVLPGTYTLTETNPSGYTSTGDVQGANDDRITLTVTSGNNATGQDFFDTQFANITGGVYDDLNGNGVRDSGEPGISGVLITLSNGATTTTNGSGLYTFTVPVGTYTMTETNPSGYTSTGDTQGTNDDTITLTVGTGGSNNNNFLDTRPVTITGHVYNDLNGNGAFNSGEPGISSVVITLSTGITAATDVNGVYTFTNVLPGTYTLTETNPSGYTSTGDVQGTNDDRITLTVTSGTNVTGQDFFDTQFANITGGVYDDLNGNGVRDSGEPGISGVLILLSNGTTTTTNSSGLYTFTVPVGSYTITETNPSGYTSTGDTQGTNDNLISVTVGTGGSSSNNFLDARPVTITGHVYNDLNGNGSFNSGELGISNVVITLSTGITAATDANGVYTFTNVLPGTYALTETNPSGYTSTGDIQGANDDRITLTATSGNNVTGQDFFDTQFANITGGVYDDLNGNGVRDSGEPGISGVLITLSNGATTTTNASGLYTFTVPVGSYTITETNPSGYTSTGDTQGTNDNLISVTVGTGGSSNNNFLDARPVTITGHVYNDLNGNGSFNAGETGISSVVITLSTGITAATDANGIYTFTNVLPGTYTLTETNLSGYTSTGDVQGANDDRITLTVTSGTNVSNQDFFDTQFAGITGAVYEDLNGNGLYNSGEPGIAGVLIILSNGTTTTTNASGVYTFTNLIPGTYTITETNPSGYTSTGDTQGTNDDVISVTLGTGGSSNNNFLDAQPVTITGHVYQDLNGNGAFNSGEAGIANVVLTLSDGTTTSTDPNGVYTFTVMPGTYTITETNPSGYTSTGDTQGGNDERIIGLTVTSGATSSNNDFFDALPVTIGDSVWLDLDQDGSFDVGEPGLQGVTVTLQTPSGVLTTTTTNSSGRYTFTNVISGSYLITFTALPGYQFSPVYSSNTLSTTGTITDSNANPATGATGPILVAAGVQNTSIDAGLILPVDLGVVKAATPITYTENSSTAVTYQFTVTNVGPGDVINALVTDTAPANITFNSWSCAVVTAGSGFVSNQCAVSSGSGNIASTVTLRSGAQARYTITATVGSGAATAITNTVTTALPSGFVQSVLSNQPNQATAVINPVWIADLSVVKTVTPATYSAGGTSNATYVITVTNHGPSDVSAAPVTDTAPANVTFSGWNCAIVTPGTGNVTNSCGSSSGSGNIATTVTLRSGAQAHFTVTATVDSAARNPITNTVTVALPPGVIQDSTVRPDSSSATLQPARVLSLGSRVWYDANDDGTLDAGEPGIQDVVLQLLNSDSSPYLDNGQPVTVTSDSNGYYTFTQLLPGGYRLQIINTNFANNAPLAGLHSSLDLPSSANADNNVDNDDNGIGNLSDVTTSGIFTITVGGEPTNETDDLTANANSNLTLDFGFYEPLSLGNRVWLDLDNDGQLDSGESGINGVVVNLYRDSNHDGLPDGAVVMSDTTAGGGYYFFDNLTQGGYLVEIASSNFNAGGVLAGYYSSLPTALNPNIGGAGNLGIDNDDNGLNSFVSGAIRSASITLTVSSEPTGESDLGPDGSGVASDGSSNLSIDFGFFQPVQISDRAWYDYDADGLQGVSGEPGVPGVQVKLFTISNTTALDVFGNPVGVQTTDSSGVYTFSNLPPGNYTLVFVTTTLPANYVVTQPNAGDETLDSDADPVTGQTRATGFLSSGEQDGDLALGIHAFVSVGGYAWFDYNHNGQQDTGVEASSGVSDVRVNLYYALTNQPVLDTNNQPIHTFTNNSGLYSFGELLPGRYYVQFDLDTLPTGYTVTLQNVNSAIPAADLIDSDADPTTGNSDDTAYLLGDENSSNNQDMNLDLGIYGLVNVGGSAWIDADGDGVYEPTGNNAASSSDDEATVPNIGVTLYQVGHAAPISTTTTDSNGDYLFRDQIPGDYYVVFNLNSLPAGYVATVQDTPADDQLDSDANRTTGQTASTGFLGNGDQNQSLDLGIYKPIVVDGRAWLDSNGSGVRDSNEITGAANVTVTLYQVGNGTPINTTHTNASGVYSFTNLPPADYYVVFGTNSLPPGYQITTQDVPGDNTVDSDASPITGQTESTGFLYSGQQPSSLDMGLWQPVKVGTYVWNDSNRNGIQDAGESGANNITVRLYENGSNTALFTGTTASGHYTFSNLPPADYYVVFDLTTLPTNTVVSPSNVNDPISDTVDSDANLSTGQTAPTGLILSGGTNSTLAMGIMPLADIRIGDSVWHDINANGIQETGEGGIENVVVHLYQVGSNQVISSDVTDVNGQYLFDNLPPGNYYLVFDLTTLPAGYQVSPLHVNAPVSDTVNSDADPTSGQTQATGALNSNQQALNLDMGIYQPAALGDSVWNDVNANGIHEAGENGIQNVLVKLYRDGVDTGLTRTTGPDGSYLFTDLVPGNYFVEVVVPSGYRISPQDVGNNNPLSDTVDSDIAPANGRSATTTLTSGEEDRSSDAGLYVPLSLGSSIWFDVNNDSLRQASEGGINNVLIELYDAYNQLVMTTTSDANGFYLFNDLIAGDYTIVIPGSNFATGKALYNLLSSSQTASDPNIGGPQNKGIDGDDNGIDSAQPLTDGIRSGTISLSVGGEPTGETPLGPKGNGYAADNGSNQTIDFAFYEPLSLGSQIWNDANHDGIQDSSELGIEGVSLSLYRDTDHNGLPDGAAIATQVTVSGGWYLFDNLAAGSYLVVIDADNFLNSGVLSNTVSSKPTASDPNVGGSGNQGIVGDDNGLNITDPMVEGVRSGSIDLYPSSEATAELVGPQATGIADDDSSNLTVGFGFYEPLSLGNRVWIDLNNDGLLNNGEAGMDGVLVNLYQDANHDQAPDGGVLLTDTTSNGGYYLFDDLQASSYIVEIAQSNFSGNGKLIGYYSSLSSVPAANASDIGDLNVDNDDDGIDSNQPATVAVRSASIQLTVRGEPLNESDLESGIHSGSASDGSANLTVDFGFFRPVLIGDKVWYDNDADGKQEALDGELGVPNVTVALFTSAGDPVTDIFGNPVAATQTDASGHYTFTNLPPGDYYVQFNLATLPNGYVVTTPNAAGVSDTLDSDGSAQDGKTANTGFLSSGAQDQTLALGIYQPLSVGNSVWADNNRNGINEPGLGEPGVAGVVVTIYDNATGTPVPNPLNTSQPYTQVSDSNGHYLFTGLQPGDYYLVYDLTTLPAGYTVTAPNQGSDDTLDSDADPVSGKSDPTGTLASGQVNLSIDLGVYTQVGVGDRVWYDDNHDGQQQPGEGGVPNIRVTLYSTATNAPATDLSGNLLMTFTKSDGSYLFSNLAPGGYYAVFDLTTLPAGYQVTAQNVGSNLNDSDADPVSGATPAYPLDNAQVNLSVDMGIWKPISIGDRVWLDNNFNGLQDAGEPGLAHVSVSLLDAKGTPTGLTTQTDANGTYTFSNLSPGDYQLHFDLATLPAGYQPTTANVGNDDAQDSDVDPNSGATPTTGFINSNQQVTNLDMGVIGPVSVGSLVWEDLDRNGIQEPSEPGVAGIQVAIFNVDGTPAKDMNGNLVSTQLTNGSGTYSFTNLLPGSYYVQFDLTTLPATYQVTRPNMGANDAIDSDASLSDGQTGATPFLTPGSSDATLAMGIHLPLGVRVGDSVWNDANGNGVQDGGESGVSGIVVELYVLDRNGLGVSTGYTQSTDIDGFYLFDELPAGEYYVVYHLDSLPSGYGVTTPNQGDDSHDSDVDPLTGQSSTTGLLSSGSQNLTLDMGVYAPVSIGDRVWNDVNGNGAQDTGEVGLANVAVTLYHADGTPTGLSETTDSNGNFLFTGLMPGSYILEVTPPAGYAASLPNLSSDDTLDSDFDPNTHRTPVITVSGGEVNDTIDAGMYVPGAIGSTLWEDKNANGLRESNEPPLANVTVRLHDSQGNLVATTQTNADGHYGFTGLPAGDYTIEVVPPTGYALTKANQGSDDSLDSDVLPGSLLTPIISLTAGESQFTWDAGLFRPAVLGNTIWIDRNANGLMDEDEPGVAGVVIELYAVVNGVQTLIMTTTTDVQGNYQFTNLSPGDYVVQVIAPANSQFTQPDQLGGFNSDVDPLSGRTPAITLGYGEVNLNVGAGILPPTADGEEEEPEAQKRVFLPLVQR